MFSNKIITIGDSLFISAFSIIAVFCILLMVSYMIDLTVKFLSPRKKPVQGDKLVARSSNAAAGAAESGVDPVVVAIVASAIDSFEKDKKHRIVSIK